MCGRTRCTLRVDDVARACYRDGSRVRYVETDRYRQSYNVSPGANMPVVRRDVECEGEGVAVHCMRWGLIPSFTKKTEKPDFFRMFNARSESVGEKASFRRLIPKNRCLVSVEGFYEWKKDGSRKQPYYIHFKDGRPLVFAALYDCWKNADGETLYTFTIITTSSSSSLQWLHDRMPVVFGDKGSADAWLDESPPSKLNALLKPYENLDLVWYPVTPAMGKTSFDGPECIKEVPLKAEEKNTISKFFTAKHTKEEDLSTEESAAGNESNRRDLVKNIKQKPRDDYSVKIEEEELNQKEENSPQELTRRDLSTIIKEEPQSEVPAKADFEEPSRGKISGPDESVKTDPPKILKDEPQIEAQTSESCKDMISIPGESNSTDLPKTSKSVTETKRSMGMKSLVHAEKEESQSSERSSLESKVPETGHQVSPKHPTKRAHEETSEDVKPSSDTTKKAKGSAVKERQHGKSAGGERQPTLLSFFGKK